jgi:hypothetical protein
MILWNFYFQILEPNYYQKNHIGTLLPTIWLTSSIHLSYAPTSTFHLPPPDLLSVFHPYIHPSIGCHAPKEISAINLCVVWNLRLGPCPLWRGSNFKLKTSSLDLDGSKVIIHMHALPWNMLIHHTQTLTLKDLKLSSTCMHFHETCSSIIRKHCISDVTHTLKYHSHIGWSSSQNSTHTLKYHSHTGWSSSQNSTHTLKYHSHTGWSSSQNSSPMWSLFRKTWNPQL